MREALLTGLLLLSGVVSAQEGPRYFGYYANNGHLDENADHVNITHIGVWTRDRSRALTTLLTELKQARSKGIKAMLSVDPFLFELNGNGSGDRPLCPYKINQKSSIHWNTLVSRLVKDGYIVPGDPAASTVVAFYPVDEPEDCGLQDVGSEAHPALQNAIDTIKNDNRTRSIPIAVIASPRYGKTLHGLRLFDWVGEDCYGCGNVPPWRDPARTLKNDEYLAEIRHFWARIGDDTQRRILVPQASKGGIMGGYGYPHDPTTMYIKGFLKDPKVVMLLPFLWKHSGTTGVSGLPDIRADYNTIGHMIRNNSSFIRQSVPTVMTPGKAYSVSITFKNTGTTTWSSSGSYVLKSVGNVFGISGYRQPISVKPGQVYNFKFNVIAPRQPGRYTFQWQMERKGITGFGDFTSPITVKVGTTPPPPPPTGGTCNPVTHICTEVP